MRRRRPRPMPPFVLHLRRRLPCPPAAATPDTQISLLYRPFLLVLSQAPLSPGVLSPGHRFFLPPSGELSSRLVSSRLIWFDFLLPYNADCLRGRCRAAVGASTAGAALRQGEIARAAHAHQIQSQEIQDQGPLVSRNRPILFPCALLTFSAGTSGS